MKKSGHVFVKEKDNSDTANPYLLKKQKLLKIYLPILLISFALGMLITFLGDSFGVMEKEWFVTVLVIFLLPCSIGLILLLPLIGYLLYLRKMAKLYEAEQQASSEKDIADPSDPRPLQTIRYAGITPEDDMQWGPLIALLCTIMPLGVYFILKKAYTDRKHYLENAITLRITGLILLLAGAACGAFFMYVFFGTVSIPEYAIFFGIVPFISGIALLVSAGHIRKKGRTIAKYQNLIYIGAVLSIRELSAKMKKNNYQTLQQLQSLINDGFLPGCFIDHKENAIVCPVQYPKIAIKCKSCGGTTVMLKGISSVCAYCGKTLKQERK